METLNSSQKRAATYSGKHLLVLAGAGTGKTKTIIARAAYLINQGTNPERIQILTFTKRAASEIVSRVRSNLGQGEAKGLKGSTFHSWCNHLMTSHPKVFNTERFTIIDSDDQLSIMRLICGHRKFEYDRIRLRPQEFIDLYSFARNTGRNLTSTLRLKLFDNLPENEISNELSPIKADIEVILRAYEEKKRERKYLDYDDMLQVVANRLQKDPKARELICGKYDHILVDEMQDTNPLQWKLLEPFQDQCHLFCVGDDAQSIYAFRGADFRNIHEFTSRVPDSEIIRLEDNYRSTQEILDVSNWLLERSPLEYNKRLKAVRGPGSKPVLLHTEDRWEEAEFIADEIIQNLSNKGKSYKDHLILVRSLSTGRALEGVFIRKKIPYITYGGRGFMESAHIKDVFSALRVVSNPADEIAWMRFLMLWPGIGEVTASNYVRQLFKQPDIEACISLFDPSISHEQLNIRDTLEDIYLARESVRDAVSAAQRRLKPILSNKYRDDWEQKRALDFPVLELLAANYSSIYEFITECLLDNTTINNAPHLHQSKLEPSAPKDKVIISTIHSAKGLEADICYVLNVSPKEFPSIHSILDFDQVEEDRRILYVALTRAKNELIITRAISSINALPIRIDPKKKIESYFLHELPENLTESRVIVKGKDPTTDDAGYQSDTDVEFGMDFS